MLSAKGTLIKGEKLGMAIGAELRFPSGDERNFLGSGALGVKPYLVLSRRGRVAPHLNVGYQWNADSVLAADETATNICPAILAMLQEQTWDCRSGLRSWLIWSASISLTLRRSQGPKLFRPP